MTKTDKKKFSKNVGQPVRFYEIFIPKSGAAIKTDYFESNVLLSCDNNIVILGKYGKLQLLDIKKFKHQDSNCVLSHCKSYARNWGSSLSDYDGLICYLYSFQSEKIVKRRVHNEIKKAIQKEYGFLGSMLEKLNQFLYNESVIF